MGPIQDRTRENLCPTDRGIIMARRMLLQAPSGPRRQRIPALDPAEQRVRSAQSSSRATSTSRIMHGTVCLRPRHRPDHV